jgi:hypothetical protein
MKRTLFSCCVWLTSLAIPVLATGVLRAETDCCGQVYRPDEGDCVCPYDEMESYGECHWYYNHCDPDAEMPQSEEDVSICTEPSPPEPPPVEPTTATDVEQFTGEAADYWYDSESGSYHYYEFTDEEVVTNETAEEAIDDLFDFVDTEDDQSDMAEQVEEVAPESADTYGYEDTYDYYSEYEDYGWEYGEPSYCPADEVPAVETAQDVTAPEPVQPSWTEAIVEDPWQEEYDYAYDDEEYEYRYGDAYDYDAEVTERTEWDDADDEPAQDEVAEDTWEDEYYSDYEEYYSEYDDYDWVEDAEAVQEEETVEPVAEDGDVVESWDDDPYDYGYDEYDYGYDYEYWEQEASDVATAETEDTVVTVKDEDSSQLQREAVLSLARTLDRFGSALQNLSQQLTDMVAEEVAEGPAADAIER